MPIPTNATHLRDIPIDTTDPAEGQGLIYQSGIYTPGAVGGSGSSIIPFVAGEAIGGNRVVIIGDDGKIYTADYMNQTHFSRIVGLTTGAISSGASGNVQTFGVMTEPTWTWIMGKPILLGPNGVPTQTAPVADGFLVVIGYPQSATKLSINVSLPVALGWVPFSLRRVPGCFLYIQSDSKIVYDGSYKISAVTDLGPLNHPVVQSEGAYQGLFVPNTLNDYPVLRFTASQEMIWSTPWPQPNNMVIYVVAKCTGTYDQAIMSPSTSSGPGIGFHLGYPAMWDNSNYYYWSAQVSDYAIIRYKLLQSGGSSISVNKATEQLKSVSASRDDWNKVASVFAGDIILIVGYNQLPSTSDDTNIWNFLSEKYGTTLV